MSILTYRVFYCLTMLTKEATNEFRNIYKSTFGIDLSTDEAAELAMHLIRFYKIVHKKETRHEHSKKV